VDLVLAGGAIPAVAAALAAAERGCRVLLAAPRLYLGEDVCASLRLWPGAAGDPSGPLGRELFRGAGPATPLRIKKMLEERLLAAGVEFVFGCLPVGFLESGRPPYPLAGLVLASRAGRQAVAARVVVDASLHGLLARQIPGLDPAPPASGSVRLMRVVLGGADSPACAPLRSMPSGVVVGDVPQPYHVYERNVPAGVSSIAACAEEEQAARDQTWRPGQWRASELLVPCAGLGVRQAERFAALGPGATEADGIRVGIWAAEMAQALPEGPADPRVRVATPAGVETEREAGDLGECLNGFRPFEAPAELVSAGPDTLPVAARADVIVVGGGTAGAAAAIGAAREGARVLVVEFQEGLGGVGTVGLIGEPYHGRRVGFAAEVPFPGLGGSPEDKMEWLRRELRSRGGQLWTCSLAWGIWTRAGSARGVAVATPYGHGLALADSVVDATGNADLAAAAGLPTRFGAGEEGDIALQGTGASLRPPGRGMVNSDFLLVDDADVVDVTAALAGARRALEPDAAFDMIPFVQTRERRRIVADHELSYLDQLLGRTYPDSVVLSASDFDSHGYPTLPFFALLPHTDQTRGQNHPAPACPAYTPFRSLLPCGLEGLIAAGIGIGMHRDASAMMRMQLDLLNQGYAAGLAAALASAKGVSPRRLEVREVQRRLVALGALPETVLTDRDSFPLSDDRVAAAVADLVNPSRSFLERSQSLAILFARPDAALPLLRRALASAPVAEAALEYAKLLGFLGCADGVPMLADALDRAGWDDKIYQGRMAEYAHLPTPVDALVLALGYSRAPQAFEPIRRKLEMLDATVTLSHHRAAALALERLADARAATLLAALLEKPGMRGHALRGIQPQPNRPPERRCREGALREIVLARALVRCGDHRGLGRSILGEYARDPRALFARHARQVLAESA
jgi:hypothetical protein